MKLLIPLFLVLFGLCANAIPNQKMTKACLPLGVERLTVQAEILGCEFDSSKVEVADVDDRFYNLNKFIWYTVEVKCEDNQRTSLTKMVQYKSGECF